LHERSLRGTIKGMFDIQHDSPVPIHEQLTDQLRAHIASGALAAGARLPEYRSLAQELVANPSVVARAYDQLEGDGVLKKAMAGMMEVTAGAAVVCRVRLQEQARQQLRRAVAQSAAAGLPDAEIVTTVQQQLASRATPLSRDELQTAIKKPTHDSSHRASEGVQDLSRQSRPRSP
jgi:GntR family transcriptional regulator